MTKTFTQDDILRLVYNETTAEETTLLKAAMVENDELRQFYEEAVQLQSDCKQISYEPRPSVLDKIFSYSRNYNKSQVATTL